MGMEIDDHEIGLPGSSPEIVEKFLFTPAPTPVLTMPLFDGDQRYRKATTSVNHLGGTGFFPQGGISKKYHSPLRWPNIWGFFPVPYRVFSALGQTPNIWPHSSLRYRYRLEERTPSPQTPDVQSTLHMGRD
jgi:hypothetical protein